MANISRASTPQLLEPEKPSFWDRFIVTRYVVGFIRTARVWYGRKHKLPIVVFYRYMWVNNKTLLLRTFFFNYVFQFILEILPWWASRRKVGNKLRTSRIKLNHNMVTGRDFKWKLMRDFIIKTVLFAVLESLNRYVKNRAALETKFEIRRLVLERILYAEIDELDKITKSYNGSLEDKVARDITSTLNFINKYLPSLVSGLYAFLVEGSELWKKRRSINTLSFVYPICISAIERVIIWAQHRYFQKAQKKTSKDNMEKLDLAMANALSGIVDIQTNNLQQQQLSAFDIVTHQEVRNKEGFSNYFIQSLSTLNKMSAFSYVIEVWSVHRIMKAGNLDHKQFSKIQQEIDHVWTIGRRALTLLRKTKHIFKAQSKVVKLLDIPTFLDEASKFKPIDPYEPFNELIIDNVKFVYESPDPLQPQELVLDLNTRLSFVSGKKYAILGQNRAGKSTLTKLITKLYAPLSGELYWNGVPYSQLPRMALRDMISYIPQTPLIIGGTIRENILMGNPHATEAQLLFAAEASGILDFLGAGTTGLTQGLGAAAANSSRRNLISKSSERILKSKRRSKKKKDKKRGDDDDDDDDGVGVSRTLSFAELGELVQPRGAFFDSGFRKNKYPSADDGSGNGYDDDDGDSDSDSDSDDSSDSSSTGDEDEANKSQPKTPRFDAHGTSAASTGELPQDGSESAGSGSTGEHHAAGPMPTSSSTPNLHWDDAHRGLYASQADVGRHSLHSSGSGHSRSNSRDMPRSSSSGNLARLSRRSRERKAEQLRVLDQVLAAGGTDISGGFAQSIALARVFVRTSAKMVILDESTSNMDPVKLRTVVFPKLLDFVEEWRMCLIVITHHFNAIRDFDHLIVMQEGKVVHEGTHDELCDQGAEWYLQLNPVGNTMLSYHSTHNLASLAEDFEDVPEMEDESSDGQM